VIPAALRLASRVVSLVEIVETLELLRQRRIQATVTRKLPRDDTEDAHRLLHQSALVGRTALVKS
jgi:hypothetical protein